MLVSIVGLLLQYTRHIVYVLIMYIIMCMCEDRLSNLYVCWEAGLFTVDKKVVEGLKCV